MLLLAFHLAHGWGETTLCSENGQVRPGPLPCAGMSPLQEASLPPRRKQSSLQR